MNAEMIVVWAGAGSIIAGSLLAGGVFVWHMLGARRLVRAKCGHMTKLTGTLGSGKEKRVIKLKRDPEYCLDCIKVMTILCARCQHPIIPGDGVRLRGPWKPGEQATGWTAWHYDGEGFRFAIYCDHAKCAEGAHSKGVWVPQNVGQEPTGGVVER